MRSQLGDKDILRVIQSDKRQIAINQKRHLGFLNSFGFSTELPATFMLLPHLSRSFLIRFAISSEATFQHFLDFLVIGDTVSKQVKIRPSKSVFKLITEQLDLVLLENDPLVRVRGICSFDTFEK